MKTIQKALLVLSATVILLPGVLWFFGMRAENIENSRSAELPEFTVQAVVENTYFENLSKYIVEQNPLRTLAIAANSWLEYRFFHDSPSDSVLLGKAGWAYYRGAVVSPCFDLGLINEMVDGIDEFSRVSIDNGKMLIVSIAPNKRSIYPEFESGDILRAAKCADKVSAAIRKSLTTLDHGSYIDSFALLEATKRAKPNITLYTPLETHWTTYASGLFIKEVVQRVDLSLLDGAELDLKQTSKKVGDLSKLMGLKVKNKRQRYEYQKPGVDKLGNYVIPDPKSRRDFRFTKSVGHTAASSSKRVLVIYDSFFYYAWDHLPAFFGEVFYVHWDSFDAKRTSILMAQADVIIFETVERKAFSRLTSYFANDENMKLAQIRLAGLDEGAVDWEALTAKAKLPKSDKVHY